MSINDEDIKNIYKLDRTYKGKVYFELEKKDTNNPQEWINNNCNDKTNYLTSDDFTDEDYSDMYVIKILNSANSPRFASSVEKEVSFHDESSSFGALAAIVVLRRPGR